MRKAVIDLGTNTFHLLVADIADSRFHVVFRRQIPVKLGEGGIHEGYITDEAFARGLAALQEFRKDLDRLSCLDYRCVATSAIRGATNGLSFIEAAGETAQLHIEAIDGKEEARYIANGVRHSLPDSWDNPYLIMDIGGGSVEFIVMSPDRILHLESYDIGAARLVTRFHREDPIGKAELSLLRQHLSESLSGLMHRCRHLGIRHLVGSAGSFESILQLVHNRYEEPDDPCLFEEIPLEDFHRIHDKLVKSRYSERESMPGLADFRVEMMVVASVLIDTVIRMAGIEHLFCSAYSLKEGLLFAEENL